MENNESHFPDLTKRLADLVRESVPWTQVSEVDDFFRQCATEFWVFGIMALVPPSRGYKTPIFLDPDKLIYGDGVWYLLLSTGVLKPLDPDEVLIIQRHADECDPKDFLRHVRTIMTWWLAH